MAGVGDVRPLDPFEQDPNLKRLTELDKLLGRTSAVSRPDPLEELVKRSTLPKPTTKPVALPKLGAPEKSKAELVRGLGVPEETVQAVKRSELKSAEESKARYSRADSIESRMASVDRMLPEIRDPKNPVRKTVYSALWLRAGGPVGITEQMLTEVLGRLRTPEGAQDLYVDTMKRKANRYETASDEEAAKLVFGKALGELPFDLLEYRAAGLPGVKNRRVVRGRDGEALSPGTADKMFAEAFGVDVSRVGEVARSKMVRGLTGVQFGKISQTPGAGIVTAGQGREELIDEAMRGFESPTWTLALNAISKATGNPGMAFLTDPKMQESLAKMVVREDPGIADDNGLHLYLNALGTIVNEPSKIVRAAAGDTRTFDELSSSEQVLTTIADFLPQAAVGLATGGASPTFGASTKLMQLATKTFAGSLGSLVTDVPDVAKAARRMGGLGPALEQIVPQFLAQLNPTIYGDPKKSIAEKVQAGLQQVMVGLGLTAGGVTLAGRLTGQVDPVRLGDFKEAGGASLLDPEYLAESNRLKTEAMDAMLRANGEQLSEEALAWISPMVSDWADFMVWMAQSTAKRTGGAKGGVGSLQDLSVKLGEVAESAAQMQYSQGDLPQLPGLEDQGALELGDVEGGGPTSVQRARKTATGEPWKIGDTVIGPQQLLEGLEDQTVLKLEQRDARLPWSAKTSGEGDFYVQRVGDNAGRVSRERTGPNDLAVTVDKSVLDPRYLYYAMQHLEPQLRARARGTAQQAIRVGDVDEVVRDFFTRGKTTLEQRDVGRGFYSKLDRAIESKVGGKVTRDQLLATLRGAGVKEEEIEWGRFDELFDGRSTVTKEQVLEHVAERGARVEERVFGEPAADAERVLELGRVRTEASLAFERAMEDLDLSEQDLRQVLLSPHTPTSKKFFAEHPELEAVGRRYYEADRDYWVQRQKSERESPDTATTYKTLSLPGGGNYRELVIKLPVGRDSSKIYTGAHFGGDNVLAHVRFDERAGAGGEKILHVAEIQSDWHQQGRKRGYRKDTVYDKKAAEVEREISDLWDQTIAEEQLSKEFAAAQWDNKIAPLIRRGNYVEAAREAAPFSMEGEKLAKFDAKLKELASVQEWEVFNASDGRRVAIVGSEQEAIEYIGAHPEMRDLDYDHNISKDPEFAVENAPFKKTWHELAFKRLLTWAVENGYDELSWDTGKTQNDRYSLEHNVKAINWETAETGNLAVTITPRTYEGGVHVVVSPDGKVLQADGGATASEWVGKEFSDVVGQEVADRILSQPKGKVEGEGLRVGGSGMRGFYDQMLPAFANKYLKKWGGKVEAGKVPVSKAGKTYEYVGPPVTIRDLQLYMDTGMGEFYPQARRHWQSEIDEAREGLTDAEFERQMADESAVPILKAAWERGLEGNDGAGMRQLENATMAVADTRDAVFEVVQTAGEADVHRVKITPEMKKAIMEEGQPLFQKGEAPPEGWESVEGGGESFGPRGTITFDKAGKAVIRLFHHADFSTLMHEGMHFFRRMLPDSDLEVLGKWAGVEDGKWSVDAEERVARGFEHYLLEGKAPTEGLSDVFARAKAFMAEKYADATDLDRTAGRKVRIDDRVREVFDELVVGDAERAAWEDMKGRVGASADQTPGEPQQRPEEPVAAAEGGSGPEPVETAPRGSGEAVPVNLPGEEVTVERAKMELPGGVKVTQVASSPEGIKWYRSRVPSRAVQVRPGLQFKKKGIVDPENAVTGQFKDVEAYDPVTAGVLTVWQTKAGGLFVVNGHHRLELAKRTGTEDVDVWIMREEDGISEAKARAIGALQNIKDGKGSPIDAAAVLREFDMDVEELKALGVSVRSGLGRDAVALASLPDEALQLVETGKVLEEVAAAIAEAGLSKELLMKTLGRATNLDTRAQGAEIASLVKQLSANKAIVDRGGLFGDDVDVPLEEMAKLSVAAKAAIAKDKRLVNAMLKGKKKGGTVVDVEAQKAAVEFEKVAADTFRAAGVMKSIEDEAKIYAGRPTKQQLEESVERIVKVARAEAERRIAGDFSGGQVPAEPGGGAPGGAGGVRPTEEVGTVAERVEAVQMARSARFEPDFASEAKAAARAGLPLEDTPGSVRSVDSDYKRKTTSGETKEGRQLVVAVYGEDGKMVGVFSGLTDGPDAGAFKVTVADDSLRRGFGSKLLDEAERSGFVFSKENLTKNTFSQSGRKLLTSWLERGSGQTTSTAAKVDAAAAVVAPDPTPAQKEAGNYKMGHTTVQGLEVTIETAKGGVREAADGSWKVEDFPAHYGYFKRTEGKDGDHVDVYIGDAPDSAKVWVVDQINPETRRFDEHKVLMGFASKEDALKAYDAAFEDGSGPKRRGAVTETSADQLKVWFAEGDGRKRFAAQVGALRAAEKAPTSPVLKASELKPSPKDPVDAEAARKRSEAKPTPPMDPRRPLSAEDFALEDPPEIFDGPVPGGKLDGAKVYRASLELKESGHKPTHIYFDGGGYDLDPFEAKAWSDLYQDYAREHKRLKRDMEAETDEGLRELAGYKLRILKDNLKAAQIAFLEERARYQLDMMMVRDPMDEWDPRRGPENLEQRDRARTDTPEFKKWFGKSKVVDKGGQPLVLFHGTESDFEQFDPRTIGRMTGTQRSGAFWFSNKKAAADWFGDGEKPPMEVYVRMENPLVVTRAQFEDDMSGPSSWAMEARNEGHDGLIIEDIQDGGVRSTVYAVFDPKAIKSVFNRGTFDPESPRILEQRDVAGYLEQRDKAEGEKPRPWSVAKQKPTPKLLAGIKRPFENVAVETAGNVFDQLRHVGKEGSPARLAGQMAAEGLEKILVLKEWRATTMVDFFEKTIEKAYGVNALSRVANGWKLSKSVRESLEDAAIKIRNGQQHKLDAAQAAVWTAWTQINGALAKEGKALGVFVWRTVRGEFDPGLVGREVRFYDRQMRRSMSGRIVDGGDDYLVVSDGISEFRLDKWERYETTQWVDPADFMTWEVKKEVLDAIRDGDTAEFKEFEEHLLRTGQAKDAKEVREAVESLFEQHEDVAVTSGPVRLERPRIGFRLPDHFYNNDFFDVVSKHVNNSMLRIETAREWGKHGEKYEWLLRQMPSEVEGVHQQVRYALGEKQGLTEASRAFRSLISIEGAYQTLTKLTGLTTALKQPSQTASTFGILGGKAFAEGWAVAAKDLATGGTKLHEVRLSGAVNQTVLNLMAIEDYNQMARSLADWGMTISGVKPMDMVFRYHAALAGEIAARDAIKRLKVGADGRVKRDASYRLLKDWYLFSDDDIVRFADVRDMAKADRIRALHGGAKTQVLARNADLAKWVGDSPTSRLFLRFQTFNYGQAKIFGWAVKEATKGNVLPLTRMVAGWSAVGLLTEGAVEQVKSWMSDKEKRKDPEELTARLAASFIKSGSMGLFGMPLEGLAYRDPDDPFAVGYFMEKNAERSMIPASARTLINVGMGIDYAKKTEGGVLAALDETARREVVLYKRFAERGDPDERAIEDKRKEYRKALEELGLSDYVVGWWLDLHVPLPAARGETAESKAWREAYTQLLKSGRDPDTGEPLSPNQVRDMLGRRPKQFAGQPDKTEATVPSSSGRRAIGLTESQVQELAKKSKAARD